MTRYVSLIKSDKKAGVLFNNIEVPVRNTLLDTAKRHGKYELNKPRTF